MASSMLKPSFYWGEMNIVLLWVLEFIGEACSECFAVSNFARQGTVAVSSCIKFDDHQNCVQIDELLF